MCMKLYMSLQTIHVTRNDCTQRNATQRNATQRNETEALGLPAVK